jgi:peptidoglycan/xylan/chitin deacetylase (PgdA/CDA1 family)
MELVVALAAMKLAISFDYDSPEGYRRSFGLRDCNPAADQEGTEALLEVLRQHAVRATFGIVGRVALDGEPPEHCPGQVIAIHRAGHEIASHSMLHKYLPPLSRSELLEDLCASRKVLEARVGAAVRGFIPPFNRPMHFPRRRAFSFSEKFGLHGRGRARQSLGSLLRLLAEAGYGWSRVSFQDKLAAMAQRLGFSKRSPAQPFLFRGVVAIPLHSTGFGEASLALVRRYLDTDLTLTVYGHPNQAFAENDQSAARLDAFLACLQRHRQDGSLQVQTMGEIEALTRAAHAR